MDKNNTFNIALCGIVSALEIVVMMITFIVPVATYITIALAGILGSFLIIETDKRFALSSYIIVSILSLLIVPDKEAVTLYILFFGYYPILKRIIESKFENRKIQLVLKTAVFTVSAIISYFIAISIIGIPAEEYQIFGANVPIVFLILCMGVFIMYDFVHSDIINLYTIKYREKLWKSIKFKNGVK